jgi:aryl-alcohol dehydrogenase-like predicted oxidoreductase
MAAGKLFKPDQPFAQILSQVAARYSVTPAQVSLAWLLHRSPVILPIPGTSRVTHLEENVAAAGLKIDPGDWAELEAAAEA